MESYCVSCKEYSANKTSRASKTKTNKTINAFIKLCLCGKKILTFIENQEINSSSND